MEGRGLGHFSLLEKIGAHAAAVGPDEGRFAVLDWFSRAMRPVGPYG